MSPVLIEMMLHKSVFICGRVVCQEGTRGLVDLANRVDLLQTLALSMVGDYIEYSEWILSVVVILKGEEVKAKHMAPRKRYKHEKTITNAKLIQMHSDRIKLRTFAKQ